MSLWTESELTEVDQLCKTLPLVEAWSIVAKDKIDGLQARVDELGAILKRNGVLYEEEKRLAHDNDTQETKSVHDN
jgi:hypothetical protein